MKVTIEQFVGFIKTYILIGLVILLVSIGLIGAIVQGFGLLFHSNPSQSDLKQMPVNIEKKSVYEEVENSSYPSTTTYNGHTLDLKQEAYKYRLGWQLVAALDVIKNTGTDINNKNIVNKAKNELKPQFTWGYDKYSKETITDIKTYQKVKKDTRKVIIDFNGRKRYVPISSNTYNTNPKVEKKTTSIPLPYLD